MQIKNVNCFTVFEFQTNTRMGSVATSTKVYKVTTDGFVHHVTSTTARRVRFVSEHRDARERRLGRGVQ